MCLTCPWSTLCLWLNSMEPRCCVKLMNVHHNSQVHVMTHHGLCHHLQTELIEGQVCSSLFTPRTSAFHVSILLAKTATLRISPATIRRLFSLNFCVHDASSMCLAKIKIPAISPNFSTARPPATPAQFNLAGFHFPYVIFVPHMQVADVRFLYFFLKYDPAFNDHREGDSYKFSLLHLFLSMQ